MEDLRFIPLLMFFSGALLVYSGFRDTTPLDMIRTFFGNSPSAGQPDSFSEDTDPFYAGVDFRTYHAPPRGGNPGFY